MNYYNEIKTELINNEITKRVKDYSKNKSDLTTYYNVGKMLSEAGKHYGEGIIKKYSKKLTYELGKGYSERNLRNFRQFFILTSKWQTLSAKLTWSHYCELLWYNVTKIQYYIHICESNNLSVRELRQRIKNKEYERLPEETKKKIQMPTENKIINFIKNPIIIKIEEEKTIGIIICKKDNHFIMEYCSDPRILSREYLLKNYK